MFTTAQILCLALSVFDMSPKKLQFACKHIPTVLNYSNKYEVDPLIVMSVIYNESKWDPKAIGAKGEIGLGQIMPQYVFSKRDRKKLKNPKVNIKVASMMLSFWINNYAKGKELVGLCGYNGGARCHGRKPLRQSMRYARKVLGFRKNLKRSFQHIEKTLEREKIQTLAGELESCQIDKREVERELKVCYDNKRE